MCVCECVFACVPVQIDKDDTLRIVYQSFQLSSLVPQLLSLNGAVHSHCMHTQYNQQLTHSALYVDDI